jgi:hypothetical protein
MMNIILLKPHKEIKEPAHRKILFRTIYKIKGKCCKLIIDGGSTDNLVSIEMVEKLDLKNTSHHVPYKVSWMEKGHRLIVNGHCKVKFQIGRYKYKVHCDFMPMDVCHIFLGRPWMY